MRRTTKRKTAPAEGKKAIRARANDVFSNALARLGAGTPNLMEGTQYSLVRLTRDYGLLNALYREHWIVRQIVDIIPSDMLKNWITLTTEVSPALLKKVDLELRRTQLIQKLKCGLQWGRLYGGAVGVMVVSGQGEDMSKPLNPRAVLPGDFCGLLIFDRWNSVDPSVELVEDVRDPEFGMPKYYTITDNGTGQVVKVHYSRIVRFTGDDLPYWEAQAEQNWGASVIESIFDELKKRDNVSWNIAQLTFMASMRVLKMSDMGQMLSATDEQTKEELYRTIQAQNWLMSNMGMQIIDASDDLQSHQYTFGGVSDVYKQFMMDIAGAARIPATKLFGRSPEGMNSTGESDLQNYYDMIAQEQEAKLRPILNKILPVLCMSVFGAVPDDLDFEFDPVSEPSDEQRTELAKNGTDIVVAALNAGLISPRTALKELKQQSERTGVWTNITDADIEKASDEIDAGGEMGGFGGMEPQEGTAADSDWVEEDHNRDKGGRFSPNGGASFGVNAGYNSVSVLELPKKGKCRQFNVDGKGYSQRLLPKEEYAIVMHAVDTNITPERINTRIFWQNIENHVYGILIVDEDIKDYVVIGKKRIK
jgi:phage-related protein (TIGR01555 family)